MGCFRFLGGLIVGTAAGFAFAVMFLLLVGWLFK